MLLATAERYEIVERIPIAQIPIALDDGEDAKDLNGIGGFTDKQLLNAVLQQLAARIFTDPLLRHKACALRCQIGPHANECGPMPNVPIDAADPETVTILQGGAKRLTVLLLPLTAAHNLTCGTAAVALDAQLHGRAETLAVASRLLTYTRSVAHAIDRWTAARRQLHTLFHDLRNALTTTQAEVEIMRRTQERAERQGYLAANLKTAADLLNKIQVLMAEEEKRTTTRARSFTYRTAELVARAAAWTQAVAQRIDAAWSERLIIRTDAPQNTTFQLDLEPCELDAIIQNLVRNGVEAARANPTANAPAIEIAATCNANRFSLIVRDSGVGFNQTYLAAQQGGELGSVCLSTKTTPNQQPRGFGLFSIRQLIDPRGGHLHFARRYSKTFDAEMTEVVVDLPLDGAEQNRNRDKAAGFTLLELIIVLAISMLIVAVGVTYTRSTNQAARTRAAAQALRAALIMRAQDARRWRAGGPPDAFNPLGLPRLELNIAQPQTWGPIAQASVQGASWNYTVQTSTVTALPAGWTTGTAQCMPQITAVGGPPPVANPTAANRLVFDLQGNLYDPNQPDDANSTIVAYICANQGGVVAITAPQGANAKAAQLWMGNANGGWSPLD